MEGLEGDAVGFDGFSVQQDRDAVGGDGSLDCEIDGNDLDDPASQHGFSAFVSDLKAFDVCVSGTQFFREDFGEAVVTNEDLGVRDDGPFGVAGRSRSSHGNQVRGEVTQAKYHARM